MHQRAIYAFLTVLFAACIALPAKSMAWGAVATGEKGTDAAIAASSNWESAAKAQSVALHDCRTDRLAGSACHLVKTFQNQCVGVALGFAGKQRTAKYSWALAPNRGSAQQQALSKCRAAGNSQCQPRPKFNECDP